MSTELDEAHHLATAYRDYPGIQLIAINSEKTPEQYLLGILAALDNELYNVREQLRTASKPSTREDVLEEAALSLENAREHGGAYGQKLRRPSNYASAARHVRTLKTGTP